MKCLVNCQRKSLAMKRTRNEIDTVEDTQNEEVNIKLCNPSGEYVVVQLITTMFGSYRCTDSVTQPYPRSILVPKSMLEIIEPLTMTYFDGIITVDSSYTRGQKKAENDLVNMLKNGTAFAIDTVFIHTCSRNSMITRPFDFGNNENQD